MESLRKNLSAYTLDDAPEDVRELYKDEFIQLYASSIKCFLICIKLGFISGRSSFAPRLNQIWRQVRSGEVIIELKARIPRHPVYIAVFCVL